MSHVLGIVSIVIHRVATCLNSRCNAYQNESVFRAANPPRPAKVSVAGALATEGEGGSPDGAVVPSLMNGDGHGTVLDVLLLQRHYQGVIALDGRLPGHPVAAVLKIDIPDVKTGRGQRGHPELKGLLGSSFH
jgi:hypothetical protein